MLNKLYYILLYYTSQYKINKYLFKLTTVNENSSEYRKYLSKLSEYTGGTLTPEQEKQKEEKQKERECLFISMYFITHVSELTNLINTRPSDHKQIINTYKHINNMEEDTIDKNIPYIIKFIMNIYTANKKIYNGDFESRICNVLLQYIQLGDIVQNINIYNSRAEQEMQATQVENAKVFAQAAQAQWAPSRTTQALQAAAQAVGQAAVIPRRGKIVSGSAESPSAKQSATRNRMFTARVGSQKNTIRTAPSTSLTSSTGPTG